MYSLTIKFMFNQINKIYKLTSTRKNDSAVSLKFGLSFKIE